jgi:hypothetical protein
MKQASHEHSSEYDDAQALHNLKVIYDDVKEASASISADLQAIKGTIEATRTELMKLAYAECKNGISAEDVLHACFSGTDWNETSQTVATKVASELGEFLVQKEQRTAGFRLQKTASFEDINPDHPLPRTFSKLAALEERHIHLEIALGQIDQDAARVGEVLREVLFSEKTAGAGSTLRSFGRMLRDVSKRHPKTAVALGAGALLGAGAVAAKKLNKGEGSK